VSDGTFNQEALSQAHIAIAVLETKVEAQGRELGELKKMIETLGGKVDRVADTLTEARGGWRFMMLLGGAGSVFGGLLTWAINHLSVRGTP
jgi:hypothetical protein